MLEAASRQVFSRYSAKNLINLMGLIKGSHRFTVMSDDVALIAVVDALLLIEFPYSFIRRVPEIDFSERSVRSAC